LLFVLKINLQLSSGPTSCVEIPHRKRAGEAETEKKTFSTPKPPHRKRAGRKLKEKKIVFTFEICTSKPVYKV
jgi:hypothetical protein